MAKCRKDEHSRAGLGVLVGILIYDLGVAKLLIYAAVGLKMVGVALWPAVAVHAVLAVWCLLSFRNRRPPV
jgi:hypothetical protein